MNSSVWQTNVNLFKARELAALWRTWAERCGVRDWEDLRARPAAPNASRPNLLWITSEDNSPYLADYRSPSTAR